MHSLRSAALARRLAPLFALVLFGIAASGSRAEAQRIGLEAGLAGVENYSGFTPSVGVSVFLPLTDRFRAAASYSQWTGCDSGDCEEPRGGYGNRGFNVVGLFRILGGDALGASVGAGVGFYEMRRVRNGESDRYYEEAITFSSELRRAVAYNSSVYLKGDISWPSDDVQPRWGFLRAGVDVGVF